MIKRLLGRRAPQCWAIKQLDPQLLHVCLLGRPEGDLKGQALVDALRNGRYSGGVRMGDTGLVLNARLFEALIPEQDLQLVGKGAALWQDKHWVLAWVPQRVWTWEGRLVAEPNPLGLDPGLVSHEDVTLIRKRADPYGVPPGKAVFRPQDALEDPSKDIRQAIGRALESRAEYAQRYHNSALELEKP